ncbi:MAG TPA: type II toxin-antitoxin system RelE/ParE family toxin [Trueperaceae bacterium]|nr:type II toxin-antitoxin system RelE/ParE family toxin [Trueperaceae bacterium]
MAYELLFTESAVKQLRKLDRSAAKRIADYLEAVAALDNPTVRGKNLTGEYRGIWRYRIGSYRALCDINQRTLTILTLEVSHRSKSYKRV